MIKDFLKIAWENLTNRKMRSWLTVLGVIIGIATVVALISIGQGLQHTVEQQFQKIGADKLMVQARTGNYGPPGTTSGSNTLTKKDYDIVKRSSGVDSVAPRLMRQARVEFNKKSVYTFAVGFAMDESFNMLQETGQFDIDRGRILKEGDKYKVVVGSDFAKETTFGKAVQVNDKITVNGDEFTVIGILKSQGNPGSGSAIYMTLDQMRVSFNEPEIISMMTVKVKSGLDINTVAENIKKDLRRSRNVKEGKEDFSVESPQKAFESYLTILNVVELLLVGLASISLIVGGVGIANTMYTAVLERRREIGIMKAVGAKNSDILQIFLIESALVGLVGGVIGLLIGMGIGKLIEFVLSQVLGSGFFTSYFPWYLIVGSLLFAIITGTISGTLPARQASSLNPVDALRS